MAVTVSMKSSCGLISKCCVYRSEYVGSERWFFWGLCFGGSLTAAEHSNWLVRCL